MLGAVLGAGDTAAGLPGDLQVNMEVHCPVVPGFQEEKFCRDRGGGSEGGSTGPGTSSVGARTLGNPGVRACTGSSKENKEAPGVVVCGGTGLYS